MSTHDCAICLNTMTNNTYTLSCGHIFDIHCINTWAIKSTNQSCPLCRNNLTHVDKAKIITGEQLQWYSQDLLSFEDGSYLIQDAYEYVQDMKDNTDSLITISDIYNCILNWEHQYVETLIIDDYNQWRNVITMLNDHFGFTPFEFQDWNPLDTCQY
jgi:hypothetical protein